MSDNVATPCFKCKNRGYIETPSPTNPDFISAEACDCPAGEAWSARAVEQMKAEGYFAVDLSDVDDPGTQLAEGFNWFDRNSGHGQVIPRPDGHMATCGGPAGCDICAFDAKRLAQLKEALHIDEPKAGVPRLDPE
jgi:hypothetical protein